MDEDQLKAYVDKGYKRFDIPAVDYAVYANFPFTTRFSLNMAYLYVLPKLTDFYEVG